MDKKQNSTLFNKIVEYKTNQLSQLNRTDHMEEQIRQLRKDIDSLMKCNNLIVPIQELPISEVRQFDSEQKSVRPQTAPPQKILNLDDELNPIEKVKPIVPPLVLKYEYPNTDSLNAMLIQKPKKYIGNWK